MTASSRAPEGYESLRRGAARLIVRLEVADRLHRLGLTEPAGWLARHPGAQTVGGSGRGAMAIVEDGGGPALLLKPLRRGGLLAPLWRDRFLGTGRPLENLTLPVEASRRGVPTPVPDALLMIPGPPLAWRAWLALPRVEPSVDLRGCLERSERLSEGHWSAVIDSLREMHGHGLEHRDLNLGNLLVQGADEPRIWILDLDRARLHPGPVPFPRVQASLRRLERSYVKAFGLDGAEAERFRRRLYIDYAAGDPALAAGLEIARRRNEASIERHRRLW